MTCQKALFSLPELAGNALRCFVWHNNLSASAVQLYDTVGRLTSLEIGVLPHASSPVLDTTIERSQAGNRRDHDTGLPKVVVAIGIIEEADVFVVPSEELVA